MQTQREMEKEKHEFELRKLELANQMGHTTWVSTPNDSEITQNIKWVPKFNEDEVETYFLAFEKIANRLKWPARHWTVLLQTALVAYELVPEAYRQKFRNLGKPYDQTFTKFARKKQILFDRWCSSEGVKGEFGKLRELMLVEEFKSCSPTEVRTHLEEQKVDNLMKAASVADNYVLTHKVVDTKSVSKSVDDSKVQRNNKKPQSLPNTLVNTVSLKVTASHDVDECEKLIQSSGPEKVRKLFKPFLSTGSVALINDVNLSKVRVLRDTGASQSLIIESALSFSNESSAGASVLIQGVEGGYKEVPLHVIRIETDIVSGDFVVGVVPSLPVWGVTLL
ncbi:uncharacterized protein [Antedon mediterranea]|uniref:uncharacterized protein n=1 Tax=Antedon mediterranea TaxID=105859 RepID=UPI003AF58D16